MIILYRQQIFMDVFFLNLRKIRYTLNNNVILIIRKIRNINQKKKNIPIMN